MAAMTDTFNLQTNLITGSLPSELANMGNGGSSATYVGHISLTSNSISGTIPTEFGDAYFGSWAYFDSNKITGSIPTELAKMSVNGYPYELNFRYNTLCGTLPTEVTSISSSYGWWLNYQSGNGVGYDCPPDPTPFPTSSPLPTTLPTTPVPSLLPTTPVPSQLPTTEPTPLPTTEPTPVPTTPVPSPLPTTEPTPLPSPVPTPHDDREYLDRNADKKMLRKVKHVHSKEKREALKIAKEAKASMASH